MFDFILAPLGYKPKTYVNKLQSVSAAPQYSSYVNSFLLKEKIPSQARSSQGSTYDLWITSL